MRTARSMSYGFGQARLCNAGAALWHKLFSFTTVRNCWYVVDLSSTAIRQRILDTRSELLAVFSLEVRVHVLGLSCCRTDCHDISYHCLFFPAGCEPVCLCNTPAMFVRAEEKKASSILHMLGVDSRHDRLPYLFFQPLL